MATVTTKLTISSSDLTSQSLSLNLNKSISATSTTGLARKAITSTAKGTASGQVTIHTAADFTAPAYVYIKNTDTTNFVWVQDDAANTFGKLHPGEFMWFTLASDEGLELRADTDTVKVEYGLFKKG